VLPGHLLPAGRIGKAHGIRGELVLIPGPGMPARLPAEIFLRPRQGGPARPYVVTRSRKHHGTVIVALEGIEDRNAAETLRSHTLLLPAGAFPADEPPPAALRGIRVFIPDPNGGERELGRIADAERPAGQTIWSIITDDGDEILFPAVREFILSLDVENGEARIAPPPGLLELYLHN
jgi:16S rRNA processing protein RimM